MSPKIPCTVRAKKKAVKAMLSGLIPIKEVMGRGITACSVDESSNNAWAVGKD
jgi:hypothetical protein